MNTEAQIKHVFEAWHEAVGKRDLDALMELYAPDSVIDSSAVLVLEKEPSGILKGRDKIRKHFASFMAMIGEGDGTEWYRSGKYYTDGKLLMWEYSSKGPNGDQLDVVESFDLEDGKIVYHRVYWGRVGFKALSDAAAK